MGYFLRVRLSWFLAGAATSSAAGMYILYKDYDAAQRSIAQQMKRLHESLDGRISALEKLKEIEASKPVEATDQTMGSLAAVSLTASRGPI